MTLEQRIEAWRNIEMALRSRNNYNYYIKMTNELIHDYERQISEMEDFIATKKREMEFVRKGVEDVRNCA